MNLTQQMVFAGLRSVAAKGQFNAVQVDASGDIYLLFDQGDGVRLLKTDSTAQNILAQAWLGAAGDSGLAMALDPAGGVVIAGTTNSTTLAATPNAAIASRTDTSTNSFVARFDASLALQFLSFTGGSRIVASAVAVSADSVFVAGSMYATNLPTTSSALQATPATGASQNGFVERFSLSGSTLVYATYLSGANGNTAPTAMAVDPLDDVYLAGSTTSSALPTVAALVPTMLGSTSGFLASLTPAGDGLGFSTYIPGSGIDAVAYDATTQSLWLSGNVSLSQFPVDTVGLPLAGTSYLVLVHMPVDGSSVLSSVALVPGTQSSLALGAHGDAWVAGTLTTPWLPLVALADVGSGFALHVTAGGTIDQTARFGGQPASNPTYASLPLTLHGIAVGPDATPVVAGTLQAMVSPGTAATQTFELPLLANPTTALPSALQDAIPSTCAGSLCTGSAGYLARLNPAVAAPVLALSLDALPQVTVRNLGTAIVSGLQVTGSGVTVSSGCPAMLYAGSECVVLVSGGPGSLSLSGTNLPPQSVAIAALPTTAASVSFAPHELDFGIETATSQLAIQTVAVSNLGQQSQSFTVQPESALATEFALAGTDCTSAGATTTFILPAQGSCTLSFRFTPFTSAANDGPQQAYWRIGTGEVLLTGFSQAASLGLSATEIDFGTQYLQGLRSSRYLYLSNNSTGTQAHQTVSLPAASPFTVSDGCPLSLAPQTVCSLRIDYLATQANSTDADSLALDNGATVLLTGETLPQPTASLSSASPGLTVSTTAVAFANSVAVTAVSSETQTVVVSNTGPTSLPLTLTLTGDFIEATSCLATLASGANCRVVLSFTPGQPGPRTGLLSLTTANAAPVSVALSGTALAILPANNGTLSLAPVVVGEAAVTWYKIAQSFSSLTAQATGDDTVLLVEDVGYGPGDPSPGSFAASFTGSCTNCYLGIRFQPGAAGARFSTLTLSSVAAGTPETVVLSGTGIASSGVLLGPLTQDFGSVPVHSTSGPVLFELTNATGSAITLSNPALTGEYAINPSSSGAAACPAQLSANASCLIAVQFSPGATGMRPGSLAISTSGGSAGAALSGYGSVDPGYALQPVALSFSNTTGSVAMQQTVTIQNTSSGTLQVGTPTTGSSNFVPSSTCTSLASGASCSVQVAYQPSTASVADVLHIPLTIAVGAAAPASLIASVELAGSYTTQNSGIAIFPGINDFGPQQTGMTGANRTLTVSNLSTKTIATELAVPAQFVLNGAACGALAPGATCTITLEFLPFTSGATTGTLTVIGVPSDGSASLVGMAYLEGFGVGTGTLSITGALNGGGVLGFGQVVSGQTSTRSLTLSNRGATDVTVRRLTSQPPFAAATTCLTVLLPAQSCLVNLTYAPVNQVASGSAAAPASADEGTLVIESDATTSPDSVTLTGSSTAIVVSSPSNGVPLSAYLLSAGSLTFPATAVGNASAAQVITLTNSGSRTLHLGTPLTSAEFSVQSDCGTLLTGSVCHFTVTATPQASGSRIGALTFTSDAATPLDTITLLVTGTSPGLTLAPNSLNFGNVTVGASAQLSVQATNATQAALAFGTITTTGDYSVTGNCPGVGATLAAGASCTLQITFQPTQSGSRTGILSVVSATSALPLTLSLSGTGTVPLLQVSPSALAFGAIDIGASSTRVVTLTNGGTAPLQNITLSTAGDFSVTGPCGTTTLAPGASCTVQISFAPGQAGTRNGALSIASSDPNSPSTVALSGTGVAVGGFQLTVDGSGSSSVSVPSGAPANYHLAIQPTGGFTGPVVLACNPINPGPYATCSINLPTLSLANGAQTAVATINTITSSNGNALLLRSIGGVLFCLLVPAAGLRRRRRVSSLAAVVFLLFLPLQGCGGHSGTTDLKTPSGTYQYQVTATATTGTPLAQTVNLTLVVQ